MELSSESDSDDCQLYTRAAENVELKRKKIQEELEELNKVDNLIPSSVLGETLNDSADFNSSIDLIPTPVNDLDPDGSSQRLSRNLRSRRSKSQTSIKKVESLPDNTSQRNLRKRKSKVTKPTSQNQQFKKGKKTKRGRHAQPRPAARDLGVIILDDDTGYPSNQLPPIEFNRHYTCENKDTVKHTTGNDFAEKISLDSSSDDDNDEMVTLSVEWNNGLKTIRKQFKLRKYQKLQAIFEELAKIEGLPVSRILLMRNFNSVRPNDTPESLNMKFYGALMGSVSPTDVDHEILNYLNISGQEPGGNKEDVLTVKLQIQNQQTLLVDIGKNQKLDILFKKCSEELKCEERKIKITFDGDCVEPNYRLTDLDVEDGDIFNVYIKK